MAQNEYGKLEKTLILLRIWVVNNYKSSSLEKRKILIIYFSFNYDLNFEQYNSSNYLYLERVNNDSYLKVTNINDSIIKPKIRMF